MGIRLKKKKANISFVMLVALIVICSGAVVISMSVSSKYNAKIDYQRLENRYIAESGIELAIGLFQNYLASQDYAVSYTKNEDGSYSVTDRFSSYLLDEIRTSTNEGFIKVELIDVESNDYLSSIGFLDFKRNNGVELWLNIFSEKDNFKLSNLCIEPAFLISIGSESTSKKSKINPLYLTVKSQYKGGDILCTVEISDISIIRDPFSSCDVNESASVRANIDMSLAKVKYVNYQNYTRVD